MKNPDVSDRRTPQNEPLRPALKKNFNAHKPYDCPDRQILPRPDPPAARAIRSAVRTVRRLERQDQRDLAQGFRPTLPAARAALARHRQGLPLRPGSAGARRGVRRRLPVRSAGDPLPRGAFHGRGLDRQENQGRAGRCGGTRPRQPHPPLRPGRNASRTVRLCGFPRRDGDADLRRLGLG